MQKKGRRYQNLAKQVNTAQYWWRAHLSEVASRVCPELHEKLLASADRNGEHAPWRQQPFQVFNSPQLYRHSSHRKYRFSGRVHLNSGAQTALTSPAGLEGLAVDIQYRSQPEGVWTNRGHSQARRSLNLIARWVSSRAMLTPHLTASPPSVYTHPGLTAYASSRCTAAEAAPSPAALLHSIAGLPFPFLKEKSKGETICRMF
jgi:hypothetical protein